MFCKRKRSSQYSIVDVLHICHGLLAGNNFYEATSLGRLAISHSAISIISHVEQELQAHEKSTDTLMSAIDVMKEKNVLLEKSLSAETRLKLDLFSALGECKRQLEIAHGEFYLSKL